MTVQDQFSPIPITRSSDNVWACAFSSRREIVVWFTRYVLQPYLKACVCKFLSEEFRNLGLVFVGDVGVAAWNGNKLL